MIVHWSVAGYGFVDFESTVCAEAAVKALQAKGIQAQMAKVGITQPRPSASVRVCMQVFSNTLPAHFCQPRALQLYKFPLNKKFPSKLFIKKI